MKSMIIGGIIFIIMFMTGIYFMKGDSFVFIGEDYDYIHNLTILGGLVIIGITVFAVLKYINKIKNDKVSGELKEGNWDGLGEYKNDIPVGCALLFIGIIVWAMWYMLIGYPTNKFSQIGQYNEETKEFKTKLNHISNKDLVAIVLKNSKKSRFDEKLSKTQVKAIAHYLRSIEE